MKMKQKSYESRTWNPETRKFDTYKIPLPEYEPDYSGLINGTKALTAFAAVLFLGLHGIGVV